MLIMTLRTPQLPAFVKAWKTAPTLMDALRTDVRAFAQSTAFRKRTIWVTCIQEMLTHDQGDVAIRTDTFWETLSSLVRDPIVDVRIRVARLLGLIIGKCISAHAEPLTLSAYVVIR